jgi:hypothetical protein
MANALNDQMPIEVGYQVVPALVIETGERGELWVAGSFTTDEGNLEHESQY